MLFSAPLEHQKSSPFEKLWPRVWKEVGSFMNMDIRTTIHRILLAKMPLTKYKYGEGRESWPYEGFRFAMATILIIPSSMWQKCTFITTNYSETPHKYILVYIPDGHKYVVFLQQCGLIIEFEDKRASWHDIIGSSKMRGF